MKKVLLVILNVLSIVPFIVFFRYGGNVAIYMLPVWPIITFVNFAFSKSAKELIAYNGCLALASTVGIFVCGQLYFKYIHWDSVGEAITQLEIIVELIYISILTTIECLIKYLVNRKRKEDNNVF